MSTFNEELRIVTEQVVSERFPELEGVLISIDAKSDPLLLVDSYEFPSGWRIEVGPLMEQASPGALYGGIANQVAHISNDYRKSRFSRKMHYLMYDVGDKYWDDSSGLSMPQKLVNDTLYKLCASHVTRNERKVDWLIIDRGAAPQLFEFMEFHDTHFSRYTLDGGLAKAKLASLLAR